MAGGLVPFLGEEGDRGCPNEGQFDDVMDAAACSCGWRSSFPDREIYYFDGGLGLNNVNQVHMRWTSGKRLAQECQRFAPGRSGSHQEAMARRLVEIAGALRGGTMAFDEAKEALLWAVAAQTERRRQGPSTVDAEAHEVVDVQVLGSA
jgi:hypothetical protein